MGKSSKSLDTSEFVRFRLKMMDESERLKTFKSWIFDDKKVCNAAKLAEAGFYFTGNSHEPDSVECFLCWKSLDGWEESDDPWVEHMNHSSSCEFVKIRKPIKQLTVTQYLEMMETIMKKCVDKIYLDKERLLNSSGKALRQKLTSLKK